MPLADLIQLICAFSLIGVGLIFRVFRSKRARQNGQLKVNMWGPVVHPMKTWDWGAAITLMGLTYLRSLFNDFGWFTWPEGWQYLCMMASFVMLLYGFHWLGLLWGGAAKPKQTHSKKERVKHFV